MLNDVTIAMRGPAGTIELYRTGANRYEYRRPFDNRESMDRALPDGSYTIVSSRGSATVDITTDVSITAARVTNWDALQRWSGRDQLTVMLAPTPNGTLQDANSSPDAYFSVFSGNTVVLYGSGYLTSPATSITTNTHELRFPTTSPGTDA